VKRLNVGIVLAIPINSLDSNPYEIMQGASHKNQAENNIIGYFFLGGAFSKEFILQ
jgi:hypothetical protein